MIRVGNAPCSWGVVSGVEGGASDWLRVLDEIAATGYSGSELGDWGFMQDDPAAIRRELATRDLAMIGAFTPVRISDAADHAGSVATALRTARLLAECAQGTAFSGEPFVVLAEDPGPGSQRVRNAGRICPEHGLSGAEWDAAIAGVTRIAEAVRDETWLRTVFHHHCGTHIETAEETARLLDGTPADLVGLCLDTGHFAYAGDDPLAVLRRHRERVWLVHFKDGDGAAMGRAKAEGWDYLTAIRNGIFCGIGEGSVDHAAVAAELLATGYDGWVVVENEAPPGRVPAKLMAERDRAYLASLGL